MDRFFVCLWCVAVVACVDVLVKECYVKLYLRDQLCAGNWGSVHNFWKDSIPNDSWYRIRYAIVLNVLFFGVFSFWQQDSTFMVMYVFLLLINTEHIFYQWIAAVVDNNKKFFDIANSPVWMEGLPWNKALARYHGESVVTSEEILTVFILGIFFLLVVLRVW